MEAAPAARRLPQRLAQSHEDVGEIDINLHSPAHALAPAGELDIEQPPAEDVWQPVVRMLTSDWLVLPPHGAADAAPVVEVERLNAIREENDGRHVTGQRELAIVAIQRRARGMVARQGHRAARARRQAAVVPIQVTWRRVQARAAMHKLLSHRQRFATRLQASTRGWKARRAADERRERQLHAARALQALWRGFADSRAFIRERERRNTAARCLQLTHRRKSARREANTSPSSARTGGGQRQRLKSHAATRVSAAQQGKQEHAHQAQHNVAQRAIGRHSAAARIQAFARGQRARRLLRDHRGQLGDLKKLRASLQAHQATRSNVFLTDVDVVQEEALEPADVPQSRPDTVRRKSAARIQARLRWYLFTEVFNAVRSMVNTVALAEEKGAQRVQCVAEAAVGRARAWKKHEMDNIYILAEKVIKIQAAGRGMLARRRVRQLAYERRLPLLEWAAFKIQHMWRSLSENRILARCRAVVDSVVAASLLHIVRTERAKLELNAAVILQRAFRERSAMRRARGERLARAVRQRRIRARMDCHLRLGVGIPWQRYVGEGSDALEDAQREEAEAREAGLPMGQSSNGQRRASEPLGVPAATPSGLAPLSTRQHMLYRGVQRSPRSPLPPEPPASLSALGDPRSTSLPPPRRGAAAALLIHQAARFARIADTEAEAAISMASEAAAAVVDAGGNEDAARYAAGAALEVVRIRAERAHLTQLLSARGALATKGADGDGIAYAPELEQALSQIDPDKGVNTRPLAEERDARIVRAYNSTEAIRSRRKARTATALRAYAPPRSSSARSAVSPRALKAAGLSRKKIGPPPRVAWGLEEDSQGKDPTPPLEQLSAISGTLAAEAFRHRSPSRRRLRDTELLSRLVPPPPPPLDKLPPVARPLLARPKSPSPRAVER